MKSFSQLFSRPIIKWTPLLIGLFVVLFACCATGTGARTFQPVHVASTAPSLWDDSDRAGLVNALDQQIAYLNKIDQRTFRLGNLKITTQDLKRSAKLFRTGARTHTSQIEFNHFVRENFRIYRISTSKQTNLVTGYFCPKLRVSATPDDTYKYPIYKTPPELIGTETPGPTRRVIDLGALEDRDLEVAWTDDFINLFWFQIQGSGTLVYPDGKRRTAHFDGSNNRPYVSIGKYLLDKGKLQPGEASLEGIDRYLREQTEFMAKHILWKNPRYIFFSIDGQPVRGAGGIPLTPKRSVAADLSILPLGSLCHLAYRSPTFDASGQPYSTTCRSRFVLVQDEGSAIQGPGRVDLYTGTGVEARRIAGNLKHEGVLHLLLAK